MKCPNKYSYHPVATPESALIRTPDEQPPGTAPAVAADGCKIS